MIGEVSSIAAIPVIGRIGPIAAVPGIVQPALTVGGFRVADLPQPVRDLFLAGAFWRDLARAAKDAGITDPAVIADIIFFRLHPERMSAGVGKLIARDEPDFSKLRAEWEQNVIIAERMLKPSATPSVFLPELPGGKYDDFVAKPVTGKVTMFVHGRNSDGTGSFDPAKNSWTGGFGDVLETYERMRETVESLRAGDTLYMASWRFEPQGVPIPAGASSLARSWKDLLKEKAIEGVKIRVIIAKHSVFSPFATNLVPVDTFINDIPEPKRDNFKYILSNHPDFLGVALHHQKFVVARRGTTTIAYCGGLDVADGRATRNWWFRFVWHDVAAKLEGRIAYDLERQFVELWNRDRDQRTVEPLAGWKPFEKLAAASPGGDDKAAALNPHPVQMLRTVSNGSPNPLDLHRLDLRRDDIWRCYHRLIGRATRFIYLENAYFHEPKLADALVKQVQSQPGMIVIVVVSTGTDDPAASPFTRNMRALRLEFFRRLQPIAPTHLRVYTVQYEDGLLHSKLILVDDEALSVGSANANPRGFFFDTEVNFVLDHAETVRSFRHRLWSHNLGVNAAEVARWNVGDFFPRWDAVAKANGRFGTPVKMKGEGVRAFDPTNPKAWRFDPGRRGPVFLIADPPDFWF